MADWSGQNAVAVAAPHDAAVDAAQSIVELGGNVVDAAVTAAAALAVIYPHMCSLGGDAIAVLRRADGSKVCINGSGAYGSDPSAKERLRGEVQMPISGPLTVTVPGVVSTWATLLETAGSLMAEDILAPAIRMARRGFSVVPGLARAIEHDQRGLLLDPAMKALLFDGEQPVPTGHLVVQHQLADTLEALARDGLDSFYRGPTASKLSDGLNRLSVPVRAEDLAGHRATVEEPISATFPGFSVTTAGPNSQGYTILRSLGAILSGTSSDAPVDAGVLAEIFFDADAHRDSFLADPRLAPFDLEALLTERSYHRAYACAADRIAGAPRRVTTTAPRPGGDTVAITAIGRDGTAISLIQSVFHSFGSQLIEPMTGLVLHNRGSFFSLDPESPNCLEAGKRPAHTLAPVIVEYDDGAVAAHGTQGGKAQSQIHTQLILRSRAGLRAQECVSAPRFIVGGVDAGTTNDHIMVEPSLEGPAVAAIENTTLRVVRGQHLDDDAGHAMIARRNADGSLDAGADPRSDGKAWIAN
jgi:gamma-glutamyltranspeptidase